MNQNKNQDQENTVQDESPTAEVDALIVDPVEAVEESPSSPESSELDAARLSLEKALNNAQQI